MGVHGYFNIKVDYSSWNYYIYYIKHYSYILILLLTFDAVAQDLNSTHPKFADKNYYLVDSLVLEELSESDQKIVDNSLKLYHASKDEMSRIIALDGICENMMHQDWSKYQFFQHDLIKSEMATYPTKDETESLKKSLTIALNNIGQIYTAKGDFSVGLGYYKQCLKIQEDIKDEKGIALSYNNIGAIYDNRGQISTALMYYHKSLKMYEKIGNLGGQSMTLHNLASVYLNQKDLTNALDYNLKSYKIVEEMGNKRGMAESLNSIGSIHQHKNDLATALEYYIKSLKIQEELGNKQGVALSFNNLGHIYVRQGKDTMALEYFSKSLSLYGEIGSKQGIANGLSNLASLALKENRLNGSEGALALGLKSLHIAQEIGYPEKIKNASKTLSRVYEAQGKGMESLKMYKLHVQMKDSLNNETTQKATIRQQTRYEFEKAQMIKENEAKETARLEATATGRRNNIQYSLILLGILVLFVAILFMGFIKVSPNIAEGIIFFAFLILFEFVLVFTEPYLEQYTNGEPMYNLLANSVLALVIFPLHSVLERLLKKRIVK